MEEETNISAQVEQAVDVAPTAAASESQAQEPTAQDGAQPQGSAAVVGGLQAQVPTAAASESQAQEPTAQDGAQPQGPRKLTKWLKRLGVAVVLCAIFFGGVAYAGYVVTPKDNGDDSGVIKYNSDAIYAEPENTLDVLFLGTSAASEAIDPMRMWEQAGIASYVYAPNGERSVAALAALDQILQEQSPQVVVVESDVFFSGQQQEYALYQVIDSLFPLAQYHHRWKDVTLSDFYTPINYTHIKSTKGHIIREKVTASDVSHYMDYTDEAYYCGRVSEWALSAMIERCNQAGATLMVVTVPSPAECNMQQHNGMQQLASKYGFTYVDFNLLSDQLGMNWDTDSRDWGKHLNWMGSAKVTDYLQSYLKENFDLADHRGDAAYVEAWDNQEAEYDALLADAKAGNRVM